MPRPYMPSPRPPAGEPQHSPQLKLLTHTAGMPAAAAAAHTMGTTSDTTRSKWFDCSHCTSAASISSLLTTAVCWYSSREPRTSTVNGSSCLAPASRTALRSRKRADGTCRRGPLRSWVRGASCVCQARWAARGCNGQLLLPADRVQHEDYLPGCSTARSLISCLTHLGASLDTPAGVCGSTQPTSCRNTLAGAPVTTVTVWPRSTRCLQTSMDRVAWPRPCPVQ